jgi:hypothetical protein
MQDYVQQVNKKPAANLDYLNKNNALETPSLPVIPAIVLNSTGSNSQSATDELHELVHRLEKSGMGYSFPWNLFLYRIALLSLIVLDIRIPQVATPRKIDADTILVLRAKMQLTKEQNMLAHFQANNNFLMRGTTKLEALGSTRNELINWIEGKLEKGEDSDSNSEGFSLRSSPEKLGGDYVNSALDLIQKQYSRYIKSRQALLTATCGSLAIPKKPISSEEKSILLPNNTFPRSSNSTIHDCQPYLAELVLASNKQKTISQQKTQFTLTLAKQLKEANQVLIRLADESHLLPSHPIPSDSSHRKNYPAPISFEDGVSQHETHNSSRRAQGWAFAATSATKTTKGAISEKLDDGGEALLEGQETLLGLLGLIGGVETTNEGEGASNLGDIWSILDGKLGAIGKDLSVEGN